jgi:hypothetical protein
MIQTEQPLEDRIPFSFEFSFSHSLESRLEPVLRDLLRAVPIACERVERR